MAVDRNDKAPTAPDTIDVMTKVLTSWLGNTAAIAVAAWLFAGISIGNAAGDVGRQFLTLVVVAAVFTVVNLVVGPIVKTLSLPFIIVTLGLALLVINALLLLLTEWVTDKLDVAFGVTGFWVAVGGAIVISLVNGGLRLFFDRD